MGRHGARDNSPRRRGGFAAALVAAAVLILGGAATGWALMRSDSPPASTDANTPSSSSVTTQPSPSTTTDDSTARATAALQTCQAEVKAGEAMARAVAVSAAHWQLHTDAQRKFDSGAYTLAQTKAQWKSSKATADADLAGVAAAETGLKATAGGCAGVVDKAKGTDLATQAGDCLARSKALATVAAKGRVVNSQWAAHIVMMAHKEHTDGAAYHARWVTMVRQSTPALAAYKASADSLAKAPACSAA